jgi:hypothetical protein
VLYYRPDVKEERKKETTISRYSSGPLRTFGRWGWGNTMAEADVRSSRLGLLTNCQSCSSNLHLCVSALLTVNMRELGQRIFIALSTTKIANSKFWQWKYYLHRVLRWWFLSITRTLTKFVTKESSTGVKKCLAILSPPPWLFPRQLWR